MLFIAHHKFIISNMNAKRTLMHSEKRSLRWRIWGNVYSYWIMATIVKSDTCFCSGSFVAWLITLWVKEYLME